MNLISFLKSLVKRIAPSVFLVLICFSSLKAQDEGKDKEVKPKKELDFEEVIARKSAYRSAIFPGWGQATNGGVHWLKLPIIYGGLGSLGYLTFFNHEKFKCFEKGYFLTSQKLYFPGCDGYVTNNALKTGMETYHQRRDMFVIFTAGFYALNILDAYVWAHLKQFDDSDDLTLNFSPSFTNIAGLQTTGFTVQLKF